MHKFIALILLTISCGLVKSQNIYSALQLNQDRNYKVGTPKKIVETNIFYNSSGKKTERRIKMFDNAGMLLTEEVFDESGDLKARQTYTNDTANKLKLARIFEGWSQFGYRKETAIYSYDSGGHLTRVIDKDANGNIFRLSEIVCNEKGYPKELSLFDGNGHSFGKEIATYFYNRNRVVTSVVSNDGQIISTDSIKIDFRNASQFPGNAEFYNTKGDIVAWREVNLNGTGTNIEEEYTYDIMGNCTENKIYKVIIRGNGKRKRELDRIFKKAYTY